MWPIFHGSVTLSYILKAIWCINMITWANESVWFDAWFQNKSGSLWPIFHGSMILPYILKTNWCINMIPWNNESVWLDAWPQNKSGSLWPIFHGSVILPYILKVIWCINMIPRANELVWLDAWPQNKSGSLWPIFHGSVTLAYILKTIWCIRWWHWRGYSWAPAHLLYFFSFQIWILCQNSLTRELKIRVVGFALKKLVTHFEMLIVSHALHCVNGHSFVFYLFWQSFIMFWSQC